MDEIIHGGNVDSIAQKYGYKIEEILDFSANINPNPLPEEIKDVILKNIYRISHYPDREYISLRTALATYTGCPIESIRVGNGATELIYLAIKALNPKKALLPVPSFSEYERALLTNGVQVEYFPLREEDDFKLNITDFLERLKKGYDFTILCNPNNPTGQILEKDELMQILDYASSQNTYVLLDETFIEFTEEVEKISLIREISKYDNLIILRAFTKYFGIPGLRLGYCLSNPILLKKLDLYQEPWSVNTIAVCVGEFLLGYKGYKEASKKWTKTERDFLYKALQEINGLKVYPTWANFFLIKLENTKITLTELQKMLEERKILIRNASSFKLLNETFFRIAIKDRTSNLSLIKELKRLLND